MRIVLAHSNFHGFGGTETYMLTVAIELQQLGHAVTIAATGEAGPIAEQATAAGVGVTFDHDQLPESVDAVIVNDAATAAEMAARFADLPRLMVAHSDYFALQFPPQLGGVVGAIVTLNDRVTRHIKALAAHAPIVRLRQPVDTIRFNGREPDPTSARRALVLGNYVRGDARERVASACAQAGLEASFVGSFTEQSSRPELLIADHDFVIGLGRCVVEAMACRRAAYVFGIAGGDGWVTTSSYEQQEADGFGGLASDNALIGDALANDLSNWSADMGPANRILAVKHHDAAEHARELVATLNALAPSPGLAVDQATEMARLIRSEWRAWERYARQRVEGNELRELLARREQELRDAHDTLGVVMGSRRFKIASAISAPLDRLRGR